MSLTGTVGAGVELSGALSFLEGDVPLGVELSGALSFLEGGIDISVGLGGSLYTTALVSWVADESKKFRVSISLAGSLSVGALVVPPPPIFGS